MIVFGGGSGLFQVPAAGGVPAPITTIDFARHESAHWAPFSVVMGGIFSHNRRSRDNSKGAIYVGSADLKPEQQPSKPVVDSYWRPSPVALLPSQTSATFFSFVERG